MYHMTRRRQISTKKATSASPSPLKASVTTMKEDEDKANDEMSICCCKSAEESCRAHYMHQTYLQVFLEDKEDQY